MKPGFYGPFGGNAVEYAAARLPFPDCVFQYLTELAGKQKKTLDLGCGTGIASRQLADHGFSVYACDIDPRMIKQAKADSVGYPVAYSD